MVGESKPNSKNNHIKCKQSKHAIEDRRPDWTKKQHLTLGAVYKKLTLNIKIQIIKMKKYRKSYQSRSQRKGIMKNSPRTHNPKPLFN